VCVSSGDVDHADGVGLLISECVEEVTLLAEEDLGVGVVVEGAVGTG
jgi:hypothetical protein